MNNTLVTRGPKPGENFLYTYTIASRVSEALVLAEKLYGPRDPSFFYAGHEFIDRYPQTWYVGDAQRKHIVIQLSLSCMTDEKRAVYQLSHEVVHLLSPILGTPANNLEEGLAEFFAQENCARVFGSTLVGLPSYQKVRNLAAKILNDSRDVVLRMRQSVPEISNIPASMLRDFCPQLTTDESEFLVGKFDRDSA